MNKLLTNEDRKYYEPLIQDMFKVCPEMMARKIKEANCQQAFIVQAVLDHIENYENPSILCVGSFEDTACEYLKRKGIKITAIDPLENMDLHTFRKQTKETFDIIFSTSVIEHVKNDEEFISDMCLLLKLGGVCVLTCDFKDGWKSGDPVHPLDCRFYTEEDLNVRLHNIIKKYGYSLVGEPNWKGKPDFFFDGFAYNFATLTFMWK